MGIHPAPLIDQAPQVQIPINNPVAQPFGLSKAGPVLRDDVMAAKHQILGRLPLPRVGINIPAHQPGRLAADQRLTILVLSHGLVAGGTVGHHRGPGVADGGRTWNPHVLTDLRRQHKARHRRAGKQKIGPHRH